MKAYILTEGGGKVGQGHITRCAALREELAARGVEVSMDADESWRKELPVYITGHYVIVDSYLAGDAIIQEIGRRTKRSLFIDDNNIRSYPGGIVVNPSVFGNEMQYPSRLDIRYLLGQDYVILRKPFRCLFQREIDTEVRTVSVIMGGTDPESLTSETMRAMRAWSVIKNIVINPASPCYKQTLALADAKTHIFENLDADEMRNLMLESDLVISAGGQTVNELIQTRTPTLFVQAADNQHRHIDYILRHRLGLEVPRAGFGRILPDKIKEMDYHMRKAVHDNMKCYDFSRGVARIADALLAESGRADIYGTDTLWKA